jgi:hypothetical protein
MFQICVHNQKVQRKELTLHFILFFLNAMINNIKIHNILLLKFQNQWNLINVLMKKIMKIFI